MQNLIEISTLCTIWGIFILWDEYLARNIFDVMKILSLRINNYIYLIAKA